MSALHNDDDRSVHGVGAGADSVLELLVDALSDRVVKCIGRFDRVINNDSPHERWQLVTPVPCLCLGLAHGIEGLHPRVVLLLLCFRFVVLRVHSSCTESRNLSAC